PVGAHEHRGRGDRVVALAEHGRADGDGLAHGRLRGPTTLLGHGRDVENGDAPDAPGGRRLRRHTTNLPSGWAFRHIRRPWRVEVHPRLPRQRLRAGLRAVNFSVPPLARAPSGGRWPRSTA